MSLVNDPHTPLHPGTQLGRYRIDALLGTGGMGAVYRGYDTTLQRPLAIKVLAQIDGGVDAGQQLLREARAASALNHPNVCTIYEVAESGGCPFIAMEYVEGPPLSTRLAGGPLDLADVLRYGLAVSEALAHAHERGVIHRDLKAANAMVSSSGRLKLVDFGLARRVDPLVGDTPTQATLSAAGVSLGTPYAMAPEQVRGEAADPRTDVWALGVLLFEMLTGTRPFVGRTIPELFASILRDPHAPIPERPGSQPLAVVISTCLAKHSAERYQRADDVRQALEAIAARPGISTSAVRSPGRHVEDRLPRSPLLDPPATEVPFVGRTRERETLDELWTHAQGGRRQVCFLAGEPGIGKTRLSLEFARARADGRATVLIGRCEEEALVPYQPFIEALRWYARICPEEDLRAQLAAVGGGGELSPFIPELTRRIPDLPTPAAMNPEGQRYRLFETVSALLAAMSRTHPVLLVVDDLHWADKPTLLLLKHIARAPEPAVMLVIGTYRDSELNRMHPLSEMLADLRREPTVTRLSLRGLDRGEVETLAGTLAESELPPALASQIGHSTEGNPFFVAEMLRHLNETGLLQRNAASAKDDAPDLGLPEGVREVIGHRLSRLSEPCNRALSLASVLGREFDLRVLEALGDVAEEPLLDAIDEAKGAHLIDEVAGSAGRYTFHHALIRRTLYDELTTPRRVRLHRRVGEALEQLSAGKQDLPLPDLAHHFVQAASTGVSDKAIDYATRAGDRMAETLAHEEAGRFYDMALHALDAQPGPARESERVMLHRRRAKAFAALGQWTAQKAALQEALSHLDPARTEERCEILSELSTALFWLFEIPLLEPIATEAWQLAEGLGRGDISANARAWLARCRQAGGNTLDAIEMDRETLERFGTAAKICHVQAPLNRYWAGQGAEAVALASRGVGMIEQWHDAVSAISVLSHYGLSLTAVGRYADAARTFDEARQFGRKYGTMPLLARAISMSGGIHMSVGDLEGAEAVQLEARELARRVNFVPSIVSPGIDLLFIAARRHDPGKADALLAETTSAAAMLPGWHGWLWDLRLRQVRAELALARGEWDTAMAEATDGIDRCRQRVRPKYEALGLMTRARALQRLGRTRDAIADADNSVTVARSTGDPALLLHALDVLIELDGTDERAAEARVLHRRIHDALPDDPTRRRYSASELVRRIESL